MRLFAFILSVLLCSCTAQTDRYIIEGTTSQTGHYYLFKGYELVDSAEIINGHYRFEGEIDRKVPLRNICNTKLSDEWVRTRFAPVILEGGVVKVVEDDKSVTGGLTVTGTKGNNAIHYFAVKGHQIQEAGEFIFDPRQREKLAKAAQELATKSVEKNLDNFASLYIISINGKRFTTEQKAKYLKKLSPEMQQTIAAEVLRNQIEKSETEN